ncbi:hypothetical protein LCGC14_1481680 [marine sediment metagenome]|uniref:Uncharacterized protein n=2 Tax=root TaxID=1 RepID=A0A831QMT7_9FLAO|nr:hypothetical protein [Pricia antarctica]
MDAIKAWFSGSKDYYQGVAIYASLPVKKTRILKNLNRGKNNRNMSTLVSELRKYGSMPKPVKKSEPVIVVKEAHPDQKEINTEHVRTQLATESQKQEFTGIRLGDLPAELRPRFLRAQKIFYDMIELKFALNDLPDNASDKALPIMINIFQLDEERDTIWEELHHWKKHRTLLTVPEDDFSKLDPKSLWRKKRNLEANITKISKRVDQRYSDLETETNKHDRLLIESSIRKSENTLHQHKVNLEKIKKLI